MKKVDPHIKVCWSTDRMDYGVLKGKHPVDCVEDHQYGARPRRSHDVSGWGPIDWHDAMMHVADAEGAQVRHDQTTLKKLYPHANAIVTEYGPPILAPSLVPSEGYLHSIDAGLYMANNLIDFINASIPLAEEQQLYNYNYKLLPPGLKYGRIRSFDAFGYYPTFLVQATGYVASLFSHMTGPKQVATKVLNGPKRTSIQAGLKAYPALRVVASRGTRSRYVTLIVVNRDPQRDITASIRPKRYQHRQAAKVWTINGKSIGSINTPTHPHAVRLTKRWVQIEAGSFKYTFPAHSITAIRLRSSR
jgi:alpha-N-arabinofuranosidase